MPVPVLGADGGGGGGGDGRANAEEAGARIAEELRLVGAAAPDEGRWTPECCGQRPGRGQAVSPRLSAAAGGRCTWSVDGVALAMGVTRVGSRVERQPRRERRRAVDAEVN